MPDSFHIELPGSSNRREFIQKSTALLAAGALLGVNARIARSAYAGVSDEIKVALVGCGGRGTGAALQTLQTAGPVTLWAVADAFTDQLQSCLNAVQRELKRQQAENNVWVKDSRIDVPPERQFVGFDAYQHAIDSGADLIILATPPGFRPRHFEAAVTAGKHVFMEKPVAVDAPGVRRVLAANEEAKRRNLMVAVGLQKRHEPIYRETVQRLQDGAIGDILMTRVYYNMGGLWVRLRKPEQTEMEYQVRNWYYFNWLSGDHIVEQHIHNIDVSNWLRDMHPIEAHGIGGRQVRTGKEYGQIFDHHCVEFTYPDGTKMFSQCRQIDGCHYENGEFAHGTKGTANLEPGIIEVAGGKIKCQAKAIDGPQQEQRDLFAALRRGEVYNEAEYGVISTMTAILGRMATYSGKLIKWDEAFKSKLDLSPAKYDFAATPPVVPNAEGYYPKILPGKTDLTRIM